ncbi:MAG: hypothetical protein J0H74_13240 [Chitinophagaceae bacterium]|nr:hypothetical protein [Chitinophagaceae bacterium]
MNPPKAKPRRKIYRILWIIALVCALLALYEGWRIMTYGVGSWELNRHRAEHQ